MDICSDSDSLEYDGIICKSQEESQNFIKSILFELRIRYINANSIHDSVKDNTVSIVMENLMMQFNLNE